MRRLVNQFGRDGEFETDRVIDLTFNSHLPPQISALSKSIWPGLILKENDLIIKTPSQDTNDHLVATVYATKSQLGQNLEKLGFEDDR